MGTTLLQKDGQEGQNQKKTMVETEHEVKWRQIFFFKKIGTWKKPTQHYNIVKQLHSNKDVKKKMTAHLHAHAKTPEKMVQSL